MSDWMRQVLESKRVMRVRLAALPFAEKIVLLERLRARSLTLATGCAKLVQGTFGRRVPAATARRTAHDV